MRTPIRYARSGDLRIAYQVVGEGPIDLLFVPGFISNLEHSWEDPQFAAFLERLASFSRLILFDKRGTGLSDRIGDLPSLEVRMDDMRAVLDTVGSERAAIFGISEGGAMAMLFAATYPERVRALALYSTYAHYPTWVIPDDKLEEMIERMDRLWGTGELSPVFAPSRAADPVFREWWARFERLGGSPSVATRITRMNSEIDIRHILPSIRVPTLVVHRAADSRVNVEAGRYLAREIPGARYVELPGRDHLLWAGDTMRVADEIEEFLTGARHEVEEWDRVLATVLFTDIVDSTFHASRLGDHAWGELLAAHHAAVRREIGRFRGREIKTMGDGFVAVFDGPARAVRCGEAIASALAGLAISARIGIHTGEIDQKAGDIGGIAVHIASRVMNLAAGGEVLVSSTVRDLVAGSNLAFADRGSHELKGLPEALRLFSLARR